MPRGNGWSWRTPVSHTTHYPLWNFCYWEEPTPEQRMLPQGRVDSENPLRMTSQGSVTDEAVEVWFIKSDCVDLL